jgi:hypothetical protein
MPTDPKPALLEQHSATEKKITLIDLSELTTRGLQLRFSPDNAAIVRYADEYRLGGANALPPIVVFCDEQVGGHVYYLADGHHRVAAARKAFDADPIKLPAIVKEGDRRAALLYATEANKAHGVRLTPTDKERICEVLLTDEEWRLWSDREIGRRVGCSHQLVAKARKKLPAAAAPVRKGKDGKERPVAANAKPKQAIKGDELWAQILTQAAHAEERGESIDGTSKGNRQLKITLRALGKRGYLEEEHHGNHQWRITQAGHDWLIARIEARELGVALESEERESILHAIAEAVLKHPGHTSAELERLLQLSEGDDFLPTWSLLAKKTDLVSLDGGRWWPRGHPGIGASAAQQRKLAGAAPDQGDGPDAIPDTDAGPEDLDAAEPAAQVVTQPKLPPVERSAPDADDAAPKSPEARLAHLIADKLESGKVKNLGLQKALALAVVCGMEDSEERWSNDLVERCDYLASVTLAADIAYLLRRGDRKLAQLPALPDLCRLFGLDYTALRLTAEGK